MRPSTSLLIVPLLLFVGCGGGEAPSCHAGATGLSLPCAQPVTREPVACSPGDLAVYCGTHGTHSCDGFDGELAAYKSSCGTTAPPYTLVRAGTCDDYRFIEATNPGLSGRNLRFYNREGRLVAIQTSTDTNAFCDGHAFSGTFGALPCCTMDTTEVVCQGAGAELLC
jgi:hypothetical protein